MACVRRTFGASVCSVRSMDGEWTDIPLDDIESDEFGPLPGC